VVLRFAVYEDAYSISASSAVPAVKYQVVVRRCCCFISAPSRLANASYHDLQIVHFSLKLR